MRFRFSGHESFPCRYTWLPKAYKSILSSPTLFTDDNTAMVRLGVGKNMVKSIRFWVQAFGIAKEDESKPGLVATTFGKKLLHDNGLDPFLEDIRTLWLLHWKISTINDFPLFSWYFLLNQWAEPTFSRSAVLNAFTQESDRMERPLSDFTKEQHFDIFLHTYLPVRTKKGNEVLEDSLDCPLTELRFITTAGERVSNVEGKREPVFEFRSDSKIELTSALFIFCLFDFWRINRPSESTISFRDISAATGSVGQIFKLAESNIRSRLESLQKDSKGLFEYKASAAIPRVVRNFEFSDKTEKILLERIYESIPHKKRAKQTEVGHAS